MLDMKGADTVLDTIKNRRSIRDYQDKDLPVEAIHEIIDAGIQAPSGVNLQPWRFVVITDREVIQRISDYCKPILAKDLEAVEREESKAFIDALMSEDFSIFYNAPVLILVLGNQRDPMHAIDCTLCAENMMLAAWSLGIGSCWIGSATVMQRSPEMLSLLQIPEGFDIVSPLIFGYPAFVPEKVGRCEAAITWVPSQGESQG
ncbi:MAG TPA: nitroreductase family protein [Methanomicrobiales archaeon]|nr:nitroreductase family protein [Methanomicrobiales archaeon]